MLSSALRTRQSLVAEFWIFGPKDRLHAFRVSERWRQNWSRITPFFNYPPDIRKAIYTTKIIKPEWIPPR